MVGEHEASISHGFPTLYSTPTLPPAESILSPLECSLPVSLTIQEPTPATPQHQAKAGHGITRLSHTHS